MLLNELKFYLTNNKNTFSFPHERLLLKLKQNKDISMSYTHLTLSSIKIFHSYTLKAAAPTLLDTRTNGDLMLRQQTLQHVHAIFQVIIISDLCAL